MLRVGRIAYLNVEPFFRRFPWPLSTALPPRALGEAVEAGRVDAGPLALADCLRLESLVTTLPFGVAAATRAQSVFLFSDLPMRELAGSRIAITGETSTSVRLLRMLLVFRDRLPPPQLVEWGTPAAATLIIGDAALRARTGAWPHRHCFDLGEEWTRWTGLPSVFAVWAMARRAAASTAELGQALDRALDAGLAEVDAIAGERRDLGLSETEVVAYLRGFTYRFGAEEERAMTEFRRLSLRLGP